MRPRDLIIPAICPLALVLVLQAGGGTAWAKPVFAAGYNHALLVREDGSLWAWGDDGNGRLGLGTEGGLKTTPQRVGEDSDWEWVSVSELHTLGVKSDGSLWAWGQNAWSAFGVCEGGSGIAKTASPTRIGADNDWAQVVARWGRSFGLKRDGTIWGFGRLFPGQSARPATECDPIQVDAESDWAAITASDEGSFLALKTDGTLWAWGANIRGTLGVGDTDSRTEPTQVGGAEWAAVATNLYFTLALKKDGSLWGWGWNSAGQLGLASIPLILPSPAPLDTALDWAAIDVGLEHGIALKTDGSLWTWGRNSHAQCGVGSKGPPVAFTRLGSGTEWKAIAGGRLGSYAATTNGECYSWGYGNLGFGYVPVVMSPAATVEPGPWKSADVGTTFSIGLKRDGTLWSWGINSYGQLGLGDTEDRSSPTQVGAASTWVAVDAGADHVMALDATGALWSWGMNYQGELGRGVAAVGEYSTSAQPVEASGPWAAVSAGEAHNLAIARNGTLWAWGRNAEGQLGIGQDVDPHQIHPRPVQVGADTDWKQASAGMYASVAVKRDGTLWAWGEESLGFNPIGYVPTRMGADSDWVSAQAGFNFRMAVKANGTLWAWKSLPKGLAPEEYLPKVCVNPTGAGIPWAAGSPGDGYGFSLLADGTLWGWGDNYDGRLGIGAATAASYWSVPVQVGADADWQAVAANPYYDSFSRTHSLGLKLDGTLLAWGGNTYGQLGNGTCAFQLVPRKFISLPDLDPPVGSIQIDGGAGATLTRAVTLGLSATDNGGSGLDAMRFSNEDGIWSAWEPYAAAKGWTLTGGGGTKTVSVQFRDVAGNVSDSDPAAEGAQGYSDSIDLTTVPTAATPVSPAGVVGTRTPAYSWSAVAGVDSYQLRVGNGTAAPLLRWYSAAAAGCASGTGACTVVPALPLASGAWYFRVRGRNAAGTGPWTAATGFTIAAPRVLTPVAPSGAAGTATPSFAWRAGAGVDSYQLLVARGTRTRLSAWYLAADAGCASGSGTCSVTPATPLAAGRWSFRVRGRNALGTGRWSAAMPFSSP
jgi:alpha-tubulin suppressor-like RCC1 family protein